MEDKETKKTWLSFILFSTIIAFIVGIEKTYLYLLFILVINFILILLERSDKKYELNKKYIHYVLNEKMTSIEGLSLMVKRSNKKVIKDIINLIRKGSLRGRIIDLETYEIVLSKDYLKDRQEREIVENKYKEVNRVKYKSVRCVGCGARNKVIEGIGAHCEFCNTFLEGRVSER